MIYKRDFEGRAKAILSDAYVFEAVNLDNEEVDVYKVHVGLPNDFLYEDLIVYCSDIDDYDILIGMDLITLSDFFLTDVEGNTRFCFQMPATGKLED